METISILMSFIRSHFNCFFEKHIPEPLIMFNKLEFEAIKFSEKKDLLPRINKHIDELLIKFVS